MSSKKDTKQMLYWLSRSLEVKRLSIFIRLTGLQAWMGEKSQHSKMFMPKNSSWLSSASMSVWYSWWGHKHGSSLMISWLHDPPWTLTAIKHLFLDVAHPWHEWNKPNSGMLFTLSFPFLAATLGPIRKVSRANFLTWHHCLILLQSIMSNYHITLSWPGYAWQWLCLSHSCNR